MNASGRFNVAEAARRNQLFRAAEREVTARHMPPAALAAFALDSAVDVADLLAALNEERDARIDAQDRAEQAEERIAAALARLAGPHAARHSGLVADLRAILDPAAGGAAVAS